MDTAVIGGSSTSYMRGSMPLGQSDRRKSTNKEGQRLFAILKEHGPISEVELYRRFYAGYTHGQFNAVILSASVSIESKIYECREGRRKLYGVLDGNN